MPPNSAQTALVHESPLQQRHSGSVERTPFRSESFGFTRTMWLRVWFYLGVPLLLGFLLGWWRVGRSAEWPLAVSLVYWTGVALLSTALQAVATQMLSPVLRRLRSPLWLTLLVGQLVAGAVMVMPALNAWRAVLRAAMYSGLSVTPRWVGFDDMMQRMPSNALLWVGLNLLFFYGLRMPRFGYEPAAVLLPAGMPCQTERPGRGDVPSFAAGTVAVASAGPIEPTRDAPALTFMSRVRPDRQGALLALEADGHYLHVHTSAGTDLVLYRLSDALAELASEAGARVHRSWWVADRALTGERHRDSLKLVNGLEVPVSRSYRLAARQRAWIT
jgi:hypothetical protein